MFIASHMGMGDMILQNGLVRTLANHYDVVEVACIAEYEESVQFMYRDNPVIRPVVVANSIEASNAVAMTRRDRLLLGRHHPAGYLMPGIRFDEAFYVQAGVPFQNKWDNFFVWLSPAPEAPKSPYIFLHEDDRRKLLIDRSKVRSDMPIVKPSGSGNFFHYAHLMAGATEIHCIVSCFMCYADCANLPVPKHAHLYARPWDDGDIRNDITRNNTWIIHS